MKMTWRYFLHLQVSSLELARLPYMSGEKFIPCIVYIHQIGWSERLNWWLFHFSNGGRNFSLDQHSFRCILQSFKLFSIELDAVLQYSFSLREISYKPIIVPETDNWYLNNIPVFLVVKKWWFIPSDCNSETEPTLTAKMIETTDRNMPCHLHFRLLVSMIFQITFS